MKTQPKVPVDRHYEHRDELSDKSYEKSQNTASLSNDPMNGNDVTVVARVTR